MEYFSEREAVNETPVHVINMNVVDNPEDATIGVGLMIINVTFCNVQMSILGLPPL